MQRGPFHKGPPQSHRFQIGHRSHRPGPSHLEIDTIQTGTHSFGLEFVGNRPTRGFGSRTQNRPQMGLVHLDHNPVYVKGQVLPFLVPVIYILVHFLQTGAATVIVPGLETPGSSHFQTLRMQIGQTAVRQPDIRSQQKIQKTIQLTARDLCRVLELKAAGSGVARVRERAFSDFFPSGVQFHKRRTRHQDLSPDFETFRISGGCLRNIPGMPGIQIRPGQPSRNWQQLQGHRPNRPHIGRHLVPLYPVPSGHRLNQHAIIISQRNRQTVVFQFANIIERLRTQLAQTGIEFCHLFPRIGIAQRQHRHRMHHRREILDRLASYPLCRRTGQYPIRILLFQPFQLFEQHIELIIANFRLRQYIILIIMMRKFFPQRYYLIFYGIQFYCRF